MLQSKNPKSSRGIRHARKFRLCTDASRDTVCSREINTQLHRVIAEHGIHLLSSSVWAELWPEPMNFLLTY